MNNKYSNLSLITLAIFFNICIGQNSYAKSAEETGRDIIQEASDRDDGFGDMTSDVTMILKDTEGNQYRRDLIIKSLEVKNDGEKRLFSFKSPNDIKGTTVLNYGHILDEDDQWIYLPAFKRVKRISSTNQSGSFVSSEFAYEDLTSIEVDKYRHRYLEDSQIGTLACFKVELIPAYENSGYSRLIAYVDKQDYLFRQVEFYDRDETLLKTLKLSGYQRYKERYWRPNVTTMTNHQTGKETVMQWDNIHLQNGLTVADFSRNAIKRSR
jgi:outer membrane lipoprotein-sorting protein